MPLTSLTTDAIDDRDDDDDDPSTPWVAAAPARYCFAAFFDSEEAALRAQARQRTAPGLLPSQVLMLAPSQGTWWRFHRAARQWRDSGRGLPAARLEAVDLGLGAMVGLALGAAVALSLSATHDLPGDASVPLAMVIGAVCGAMAGLLAVVALRLRPVRRRFDRDVRRQLLAGRRAVVVHGLTPDLHRDVATALRADCRRWCEQTPDSGRI